MLTVLQENFSRCLQGTITELEEFLSSLALAQRTMELYPAFLDLFGFHSLLPRAVPTYAKISI